MARRRRYNSPRVVEPILSFRIIMLGTGGFVATVMIVVAFSFFFTATTEETTATRTVFPHPQVIPSHIIQKLDAILLLGGGVPSSLEEPPMYVQRRCDDAAAVIQRRQELSKSGKRRKRRNKLPVLCLSAGTAHLPQLLSADGLPVWESTSSAAYLQSKHGIDNVFVETTSYDTIGNAFYARTSHTDVVGWRKLLIITNEFHMARTTAIFNWIFGIDKGGYELYYLSSPNVGLDDSAIRARTEKEMKGLESVKDFAKKYTSLKDVWSFLNEEHSLYTASKLVERGKARQSAGTTDLIKKSYGGSRRLSIGRRAIAWLSRSGDSSKT